MTSMPGGRAVGRRRRRRVAGRGADDRPRAPASTALATATTMPAVLERAGRVLALDLEVQVGAGRARRRAGAARTSGVKPSPRVSGGVASRDRQERAVALDQPRPGRPRAECPASVIDRVPDAAGGRRASRPSGRDTGIARRRTAPGVADPRSSRPRGRSARGRPGPPTRSRRRRRPGPSKPTLPDRRRRRSRSGCARRRSGRAPSRAAARSAGRRRAIVPSSSATAVASSRMIRPGRARHLPGRPG